MLRCVARVAQAIPRAAVVPPRLGILDPNVMLKLLNQLADAESQVEQRPRVKHGLRSKASQLLLGHLPLVGGELRKR